MPQMLFSTSAFAMTGVWVIASVLLLHGFMRYRARKYPPGPAGDPIIGNVRHVPTLFPWLYYTELKKRYGDLVFVPVVAQKILLLNSYEVATELLSKRGLRYSERFLFPLMDEALGVHPPMSPNGSKWKEERRMFHNHLGKESVRSLHRESVEMLSHDFILQSLKEERNTSEDYVGSLVKIILRTVYGIQIDASNANLMHFELGELGLGDATILPGKYWVNLIPGLPTLRSWYSRVNPKFAAGQPHIQAFKPIEDQLIKRPFTASKKLSEDGRVINSFVSDMLHDDSSLLTEDQKMYLAGSSFVAGFDTTGSTVQHFIKAMLLRPDIQKKAQEEIDHVTGRNRLPTVDDLVDLPVVEAIYKEVLRWNPVAPFTVPRTLTADDVFRDYVIPKGTMVIQNTWGICMDESIYESPEEFKPERFLVNSPPMDPRLYVFGIGRRVCPGMYLAEGTVLAAIMALLATVDIVKGVDANGKEIPVDTKTTGGFINAQVPFAYKLKARSEAAIALLHHSIAASS